ncbi:protein prenyltransferase alpha subunit repeat-containing protein 1-like [Uloborus diversus]|uniref:protein prenyltransferase alpha subunit repeat-containing protein 1-like n=1 Tax=Uloborus diversus TaxID=327109 RepID=UPI002409F18B|nr:protein prenyltransferase alpha subunit repeat-containing protein 1-like [Uloborus diversus]XP_054713335.1 protein prenyltransferase alpha subunit repeat-containing protein 1-like [Uloborus diversus]
MDADVLAERILCDLKNTFNKDPLIDEFDILPVHESTRNTCPVIHIEHKVALEDWCVKHVYVYAYSNFFSWRKKPHKIDPDNLLIWTCAILLINPEIETVWNARKELLCQNLLQPSDELRFTEIVLSRKPKSSQVFAHRKFVLLELRKKSQVSSCILQQVIEHEFFVCTRVASLYPNNYYAWCHRSWLMQEILHLCVKIISEELLEVEHWITSHISDYSGFHYRQFLISSLRKRSTSKQSSRESLSCPIHSANSDGAKSNCHLSVINDRELAAFNNALEKELVLLSSLQTVYPGHETLWNHRRYILHEFQLLNTNDGSCPPKFKNTGDSFEDDKQRKRNKLECEIHKKIDWDLLKEEAFLAQSMTFSKHNDWEKILIARHVKWLQNVILWPVTLPNS